MEDEDIAQKLFLDSASDAYTSENECASDKSDSDQDETQPENIIYWLCNGMPHRCCVCSTRKKQSRTIYVCPKCNMALCVILQDVPHALQILTPTPHWKKGIT